MPQAYLEYGWYMSWKEMQYNYYPLMDYLKNKYDPDDLWSNIPPA